MSLFQVNTKLKTTVNGREYTAELKEDVQVDFSAAGYSVGIIEEDSEIELVPDNTEFLHELCRSTSSV